MDRNLDAEERELRGDPLARSLRAGLRAERAPGAWTREALAVPALAARGADAAARRARAEAALPPPPSALRLVLPHLLGVTLLLGLLLAFALRPEVAGFLGKGLTLPGGGFRPDALAGGVGRHLFGLLLLAPLVIMGALEGVRAAIRR